MSENTLKNGASGNLPSKAVILGMVLKNFEKLPDIDQKMFSYGPLYLGGNAGLVGLISNSLYRRTLNVTKLGITCSLSMVIGPFMTTCAVYTAAVSTPLLLGDLCPTCSIIRGALVGAISGGVYPILLALPLNLSLAALYNTAPIPEKGHRLRHCMELSKPVLRRMRAVVILQGLFGSYLGSRHFETYTKLARLSFGSDGEELKD